MAPTDDAKAPNDEDGTNNINNEATVTVEPKASDKEDDCSDLTDNNNDDTEEQSSKSFPQRLLEILSNEDHSDIISWLPHGNGFIIHKKRTFANEVLPRYFKATKFTSFTRKLNRWGFSRAPRGPETGAYFHRLFRRDKPELSHQMTSNSGNKLTAVTAQQQHPIMPNIIPSMMAQPMGMTPMPMFQYMPNPMFSPQQQQIMWQQQMQMFYGQQMQMLQMQMSQQQQQQRSPGLTTPIATPQNLMATPMMGMGMQPMTMMTMGGMPGMVPMMPMPMAGMPPLLPTTGTPMTTPQPVVNGGNSKEQHEAPSHPAAPEPTSTAQPSDQTTNASKVEI